MNEENITGATEVDPMTMAAENLDEPSFPCLAGDRICRFKLVSAKVAQTKTDANRQALTTVFSTEADYVDTEGKPLRKGFKVYNVTGLTESEGDDKKRGRSRKQIAEDVGMLLKWCGIKGKTPMDVIQNPTILEGYVGDCRVQYVPERDGFPPKNTVKMVLPG